MNDLNAAKAPSNKDEGASLTPMGPFSGGSARAHLVRKLTDIVVLPAGRISSNDRSLVADILLQAAAKVDAPVRAELARRVARIKESPPALLRMLILDEPEVAREILVGAGSVPEALLIEAARKGLMSHRMMIARRPDLTTSVADAVLAFNEVEVAKAVLKHADEILSPAAVNKLVAQSATAPDLPALLLRRNELEPAHGFLMFWWVDSERRRRILTRFSLDRSLIQDALSNFYARMRATNEQDDPVLKQILQLAERRHRPRGVDGEPVSMDLIRRTMTAARKNPSDDIINAVRLIGGISHDLAARIIRDKSGESFAVICKGLGLPRDDFYSIILHSADDVRTAPEMAEDLLSLFDTMARDFARAVLRYWDWDANPRIAEITRLLGISEGLHDANSF